MSNPNMHELTVDLELKDRILALLPEISEETVRQIYALTNHRSIKPEGQDFAVIFAFLEWARRAADDWWGSNQETLEHLPCFICGHRPPGVTDVETSVDGIDTAVAYRFSS